MSEMELSDLSFDNIIPKHNFIFVDMQGFFGRHNKFICKEFCIMDENFKFHALIKSPYSLNKLPELKQRCAKWLSKNFHGLSYDSGDIHIIDVIQEIYPKFNNKIAVVRGAQKIEWLKHMFRTCGEITCINIQDQGFEMDLHSKQAEKPCHFHRETGKNGHFHCASKNAEQMKEIVNNNLIFNS